MQSEGPLPYLQEPSTGPYDKPDESILYFHILYLYNILVKLQCMPSVPLQCFTGFRIVAGA